MGYIERKEYNNVITVKLVIPGGCNAHCTFCYMKNYENVANSSSDFMVNFISSLSFIIDAIGDKNPISLDITGNEPTYNVELLKNILQALKRFNIKNKVIRTTITTNGYNLKEVAPYFDGVIDYVNISVHDFRKSEREKIMRCEPLADADYISVISYLKTIGIKASAISVIYQPIHNFHTWRDAFIEWCIKMGFIGLRLRCDVFWENNNVFDQYMNKSMADNKFMIITHENTLRLTLVQVKKIRWISTLFSSWCP